MAKPRKNLNTSSGIELYQGSVLNPEDALPEGIEGKLSIDTGEGKKLLQDVFSIPCEKLHEFTLKEEADFSPWSSEKFEELVVSIQELGVLHPIVVRPLQGQLGQYEILAGEHRWKASKQLGKTHIPARILSHCSDEQARSVFTLTNILSRELTLLDKIQGWSRYYEATKGKTFQEIQALRSQGILEDGGQQDISKRQIYRYHRINSLCLPLKMLIAQGFLSQKEGETLAVLSPEEQALLSEYVDKLCSPKAVQKVLALKNLQLEDYDFDREGLDFVFSDKHTAENTSINTSKNTSFSEVMEQARTVLKKQLPKESYGQSGKVLEDSLELYRMFSGNTKMANLALREYQKNHPELQ